MSINKNTPESHISTLNGLYAISPIGVFIVSYLVISIITGDFYSMPLSVAFLIAAAWAIITARGNLQQRIETFSREAGSPNILYMIWIFIMAGTFASLVKEIGAVDVTVNLILQFLPARFILPGIFLAACFISFSIGTSVGTVVALSPLAVEMAESASQPMGLFIAAIIGGAFFGDNLSFISDTTIAATRTQGCNMKDKFKSNFAIVLPAALITLIVYSVVGNGAQEVVITQSNQSNWLILPYLLVIVTAIIGLNVMIVLTLGILTALVVAISYGHGLLGLCKYMGSGIDSMGNLIIITLLAGGLLGIIKSTGGILFILQCLTRHIEGRRGAQATIALLAAIVNICTANNTVAIITVGSLSHDIAQKYGIPSRKSASLLDTASCIIQCLIPYGAQTLLAVSIAGISPVEPWQWLYYPWALCLMVVLSIIITPRSGRPSPSTD